jgi:uncharacterized HAD superfamily protein
MVLPVKLKRVWTELYERPSLGFASRVEVGSVVEAMITRQTKDPVHKNLSRVKSWKKGKQWSLN